MYQITLADLYVFLVEPSAAQSRIIEAFLNELGVRHVARYQSGREALAAMAAEAPDLVISAMHLPDITGTELVQEMRASEGLKDIAFMLVSSETNYRYLEPIRQAGAVALLPKPFDLEHLKRALSATLDLLTEESLGSSTVEIERCRVLIVDDSPIARRFVRRVLENLGLEQFTEAVNGREAATLVEQQMFDLVVTDYNMPEMDGGELVDFIRHRSHQPTVPILMVTSESNEGRLASVQQAGVSAVCDKPFEPQTVRRLLEQILAADRW